MKPNQMHTHQSQEQNQSVIIWIIASILLHLLIMLIIMTYKFHINIQPHELFTPKQEQYLLLDNPPQQQTQQQAAQPQQQKEEEKKETTLDLNKLPLITPGKSGVDHQDLSGVLTNFQNEPETQATIDETQIPDTNAETIPEEEQKEMLPTPAIDQPIVSTPHRYQTIFAPEKVAATLKKLSKPATPVKTPSEPSQDPYRYVPAPKQPIPVKTKSFKDLGLGFNNQHTTFGNSANMGLAGISPDIPTGEELRYVTYLNQMANMIVSSLNTNHYKHWLSQYKGEPLMVHIKVNRAGQLLESRMIQASQTPGINTFILDSVQQVGLYNTLPKFITKDTFEIAWTIKIR